jgi:sugar diacid utilization regulator
MINKILAYFPNSVTQSFPPEGSSSDDFHWFQQVEASHMWVGIPKTDVPDSQLELLKILFHHVEQTNNSELSGAAKSWHRFLFDDGSIPASETNRVRFIQFKLYAKDDVERTELAQALHGFLPDHILIWLDDYYGLLVEESKPVSLSLEELESIASTFESDFFIKISFYVGKFQLISAQLPSFFEKERESFIQATTVSTRLKVANFEKIFPLLLASGLPDNLRGIIDASVLEAFADDRESLSTVKVFLESNSNASLAAKKLYVHRNTLQYRLDKFTEKTGINLKDFDSATMVYFACLYEDLR